MEMIKYHSLKIVKCYNPNPKDAYNDIANNIKDWIKDAIKIRKEH